MEQIKEIIQSIFSDVRANINDSQVLTEKIVFSIVAICVWYWLTHELNKLYDRKISSTKVVNVLISTSNYFFGLVFLVLFSIIWMSVADSVILFLLLIGALALFSIKGLFSNIIVWTMLLRKKYFKIYDRIEIDNNKGIVTKVTPLYFQMMELSNWFEADAPTGRVVRLPNRLLLDKPLFNYNGLLKINWREVEYTIRPDSDWEKAEQILTEISDAYVYELMNGRFANRKEEIKRKMDLFDGKVNPVSIVEVNPIGITLKVRFPVYYTEGTAIKTMLNKQVLQRFRDESEVELVGTKLHITDDET
ncbi:mechanosensitive ion channel family protein [Tetragenococcus solitarius]|uniref:Mechanosensitive ion channel MscS domain-containing protein n=1 Tax=Tetragenococcus solitarius TaxID=71453 RepID=A0ABN3Y164_9ENTE|nr:mechanosensitive ion channel domain-containing protein [Tetragenococcus solitarius]